MKIAEGNFRFFLRMLCILRVFAAEYPDIWLLRKNNGGAESSQKVIFSGDHHDYT